MKKIIYISIICLMCNYSYLAYAQGFETYITKDGSCILFDVINAPYNHYLAVGSQRTTPNPLASNLLFYKLNAQGDIVVENEITSDLTTEGHSTIARFVHNYPIPNEYPVLSTYNNLQTGDKQFHLIILDENLTLVWDSLIGLSNRKEVIYYSQQLTDSLFLLQGYLETPTGNDIFAYYFNIYTRKMEERTFPHLADAFDKGIMWVGRNKINVHTIDDIFNFWVLNKDDYSVDTVMHNTILPHLTSGAVYTITDSTYFLQTSYTQWDMNFQTQERIAYTQLDENGNVVERLSFGIENENIISTGYSMAVKDNYLYMAGFEGINSSGVAGNFNSDFLVFYKYDYESDAIIWQKIYPTSLHNGRAAMKIEPTADNGLIAVGAVADGDHGEDYMFIMKLDELGNLSATKEVDESKATPWLTCQLVQDEYNLPPDAKKVSLYDMLGQHLTTTTVYDMQLAVSDLPQGIYYVKVILGTGKVWLTSFLKQ